MDMYKTTKEGEDPLLHGESSIFVKERLGYDKPWKPKKVCRCPIWISLTCIVLAVIAIVVVSVLFYFYFKPGGWREQGDDNAAYTVIASLGGGAVLLVAIVLFFGCWYCIICRNKYWEKRKIRRHMKHEAAELARMEEREERFAARKADMREKHDELRQKYGLTGNSTRAADMMHDRL
jgi:uncharacterized membrane protein